jgi:ketosteroid isomerase-like protein
MTDARYEYRIRTVPALPSRSPGDTIAPLRDWLRALERCVRAVDFEGGRELCAADLFAFGTVAEFVDGIDTVMDAQWRKVWGNIRDFTIGADEARGGIHGDHGWVAAPWDSVGIRPDGSTFSRPGRLTIIFSRRHGGWLATHTHFSLSPASRPS